MIMKSNDFSKQLSRFLAIYLPHERNVSPNTVSAYRDAFLSFLIYLRDEKNKRADNVALDDINRDNIAAFLIWLDDRQGCGISTRNSRLAAFKAFASYLLYNCVERMDQWQKILAIKGLRKEYSVPSHFSEEGIKLLLKQPRADAPPGLRHLAILVLMYDTGCRVQELADLTVDSLRIICKPYSVKIYGKGRKTRIVPVSDHAVAILTRYLQCYRINMDTDKDCPLFYSNSRDKLTRAGITYILQKYANMARTCDPNGIPETVSCHQLRHSRAMHLLQSGVNLVWIRDLLGHVSIQTTEIYARADSKQKREAIEKASENLTPSDSVRGQWVDNKDMISWLKSLGK